MGENLPKQAHLPTSKPKFNLITNPTIMGWLTIVGLPLGVWGIYLSYSFNKEAKPVYRVLSDVVVTDSRHNSKIKVYYDSVEVKNVRAATIAIWNAGNEYLDKEAFSRDRPLSIKSTVPVQILEAKTVATTRPELKFTNSYYLAKQRGDSQASPGYLTLKINGDEGLEANDGGVFSIVYTGKASGRWYADARIKGIPKGIQYAIKPIVKVEIWHIVSFLIFIYMPFSVYRDLGRFGFSRSNVIFLSFIITISFVFSSSILWAIYNQVISSELPVLLTK